MPILNHCLPMKLVKGTDTSKDTVTADAMLEGATAHDASGNQIIGVIETYDGTVSGGLVMVTEPTMYSYNGTVLPALPEWDKEKYPYALITLDLDNDPTYRLVYTKAPFIYSTSVSNAYFAPALLYKGEHGKRYLYAPAYEVGHIKDWANEIIGNMKLMFEEDKFMLIWSSYDILKEDNSIYSVASTPIPIYE